MQRNDGKKRKREEGQCFKINNKQNKMKWKSEIRKVSSLKEWSKNPRNLTEKGLNDLEKSIRKFGIAEPIVINTCGTICGGHGRKKILERLNITEVDCYVPLKKLTDKEFEELNIRLNANIAGEWNTDILANEFEQIDLIDWGLSLPEWDIPEATEDDYEQPAEIVTSIVRGDIFELTSGKLKHRIGCLDATSETDVKLLMGNEKADMIWTDPPYSVNYAEKNKFLNTIQPSKRITETIKNDNLSVKEISETLWRPAFKNLYDFAKDDCSFYMTMCQGGDQMMMMMMMMMSEHWQVKHELIWVKNAPVFSMGRLDYDYQHEPMIYGWKKKHNFYGKGKFLKSIWEINKPHKSDLHPTMKPIELIANALLNSSKENDICLDLFGGSGSTLIACHELKRNAYLCEISEQYCEIIIQRYCTYMKKENKEFTITLNGKQYQPRT